MDIFAQSIEKKKFMERVLFLVFLIIILLSIGTFAYSKLEGWSLIDSLYFSTVTLTTIGYGDLHPTSNYSKLFTVFFVLTGVGMVIYSFTFLGAHYFYYLESQSIIKKGFEEIRKGVKGATIIKKGVKGAISKIYGKSKFYEKKPDKWVTLKFKDKEEEMKR